MTHAFAARGARQTAVLAAIVGLHFAVFLVVTLHQFPPTRPGIEPVVRVRPLPPPPKPEVVTPPVELMPGTTTSVAEPDILVPDIKPDVENPPSVPRNPGLSVDGGDFGSAGMSVEFVPPRLRTRPASVAAAINACYPAASRRMDEEGTVIALVTVGPSGSAVNWSVAQSSGFARLDSAIACVLRKLEFVAGRRDGQAVAVEAKLPIVFQLD